MTKGSDARPVGADSGSVRPDRTHGSGPGLAPTWALSASDLTFLAAECRRCLYRKIVLGEARPRAAFPQIFNQIDRAQKAFYRRADLVAGSSIPGAAVVDLDRWVKSAPLPSSSGRSALVLCGRLDALLGFEDGVLGLADFKTAAPKPELTKRYSTQLHSYAWCLERPSTGEPLAIERLGLLCFSPDDYVAAGERAVFDGSLTWLEIERDDVAFCRLLLDVMAELEGPEAPPAAVECAWCPYRSDA
jgi:hypothetical protein